MTKVSTIEAYLALQDSNVQKLLFKINDIIAKSAPEASQTISYGLPTYKWKGNLIHFAAFKSHIGLYPGPDAIVHFSEKLKKYKTSKGAIQFPLNEEIPFGLIEEIVNYRIETQRNGGR